MRYCVAYSFQRGNVILMLGGLVGLTATVRQVPTGRITSLLSYVGVHACSCVYSMSSKQVFVFLSFSRLRPSTFIFLTSSH